MAEFHGTVELIAGITPKNGGDFALVGAHDVQIDNDGNRLDTEFSNLKSAFVQFVLSTSDLEDGSLDSQGEEISAAHRVRTKIYVPVVAGTVIKSTSINISVFEYDLIDKTFLLEQENWAKTYTVTQDCCIRILWQNNNDATYGTIIGQLTLDSKLINNVCIDQKYVMKVIEHEAVFGVDNIGNNAVTEAKISDNSVSLPKLGSSIIDATKNILNAKWEQASYNNSTGAYTPTSAQTHAAIAPVTSVEGGKTYTFSHGANAANGGTFYILQFDGNGELLTYTSFAYGVTKTIIMESGTETVGIMAYRSGNTDWNNLVPLWTQLEKGLTATEYIPPKILNRDLAYISNRSVNVAKMGSDIIFRNEVLISAPWEQASYNNSTGAYTPTSAQTHAAIAPVTSVEGNQYYTLTHGTNAVNGGAYYVMQFDSSGTRIKDEGFGTSPRVLKTEQNAVAIGFMVYKASNADWKDLVPDSLHIYKGTEATPVTQLNPGLIKNQVLDDIFSNRPSTTVKTIAHRGDIIIAPQCTAPAFIIARKRGITIMENDLTFSEDGEFVMWHDPTLGYLFYMVDINGYDMYTDGTDYYWVKNSTVYTFADDVYTESVVPLSSLTRCLGSNYAVNSSGGNIGLPLSILKRIDFGVRKGLQYQGTQILTFREWLLLCKQLGASVYIDKKITFTDQTLTQAVEIVKSLGMSSKATWMGLTTAQITLLRTMIPDARCGIDATPSATNVVTYADYNTGGGFFFEVDAATMTEESIHIGLNAGFDVEAWYTNYTSETEETIFNTIRTGVAYGLTGITLDHYRVDDAFQYLIEMY